MNAQQVRPLVILGIIVSSLLPAGVEAQLPTPAAPTDMLPTNMLPTDSRVSQSPPVAALVESILAGEDDPAVWARLEEALGEGAALPGDAGSDAGTVEAAGRSTGIAPSWWVVPAWMPEVLTNPSSPEMLAALIVVGLLLVAGVGVAVGTLRRHRTSRPQRSRRVRAPGMGRRRVRGARATCRDAARLEARLRHRRAA